MASSLANELHACTRPHRHVSKSNQRRLEHLAPVKMAKATINSSLAFLAAIASASQPPPPAPIPPEPCAHRIQLGSRDAPMLAGCVAHAPAVNLTRMHRVASDGVVEWRVEET